MSELFSYFYYLMSGEKKLILREFEWFQVQTKVRQIMSEILQPLEKRVMNNTQSLSKLTEAAKVEATKVQALTLLLNDDPLIFEHGIFARIEQKFTNQRILIQQLAAKIDHAETYITSKGEIVDLRLAEATTAMSNLQQYKKFVSDELEAMRVNGEKSQNLFKDSFDTTNEDIAKAYQEIAKLKAECERIGLRTEKTQAETRETKIEVDLQITDFKEQIKDINLEHELAVNRISQLQRDLHIVGQLRRNSSKFEQIIKDFQCWVKNIEFKVQVIQPMLALSQTNDYLHHVLPAPFQPNLSVYFYNRYRTLLQEILANDFSSHRQKEAVSAGLALVREVHKRSLKIAFQLKKEVLRKKGVDIDMLPHEKRQEQLNNVQLEEHDVQMAPTLIDKPQNQPSPAPVVVAQLISDSLKEMADRLEAEMKDSKIYIMQMEEQLMKRVEDTQSGVKKVTKRVQELQILSALGERESRQRWGRNDRTLGELGSNLGELKVCVKDIFENLVALSEIQRQDERDRQGIMLLGVRQQHRDDFKDVIHRRKQTVELDRQCLSCSGNPNYYNEFFKMACLTYASSPVRLEGAEFERLELIEKLQSSCREGKKRMSDKKENGSASEISSHQGRSAQKDAFHQNPSMNRYDSQNMKLPSRQTQSASEIIRKPSTSLQMKQPQESPRIILASELSHHLMSRNRARLFNRRGNESKSRREESSREKSEYMQTVSKQFKDLQRKNEEFIK